MQLTAATLFLAFALSPVFAHPHASGADSAIHNGIVKRHHEHARAAAAAAVASPENETLPLAIRVDEEAHLPHRVRFPGDHDPAKVPDGLEYDEHDDDDEGLFGGYDDDYEFPESMRKNVTAVEEEESKLNGRDLEARGSGIVRGLAWTNEVGQGLKFFQGKVMGAYTWTEWRPVDCAKYDIPFFPMLKGYEKRDKFKAAVTTKGYADGYIMAMNEVNIPSESPMDPGRAAWLIRTYLMPLKKKFGWKIVGPSTANGQSAINWYDKLQKQAPDVWAAISIIPVHYYGTDPQKVIDWLNQWYARYKKPLWLTECACHSFTNKGYCSQSQTEAFMRKIEEFCKRTWWCQGYFPYGTYVNSRVGVSKVNALFSSQNSLSNLGKEFLSI